MASQPSKARAIIDEIVDLQMDAMEKLPNLLPSDDLVMEILGRVKAEMERLQDHVRGIEEFDGTTIENSSDAVQ